MNTSREKILAAVKANQPGRLPLPELNVPVQEPGDLCEQFSTVATRIGSKVFEVNDFEDVKRIIGELFPGSARMISTFTELADIAETGDLSSSDPHTFQDVDLVILKAHFGIAENGALWVTEELLSQRVLPFITQHLALVVHKKNLFATMHQAYQKIADMNYGFGTFIAGPSKTADIEQSLVLGAHGPRSLSVFLIESPPKFLASVE